MEDLYTQYLETAEFNRLLTEKESKRLFLISMFRLIGFFGGFAATWIAFTISSAAGLIILLLSLALFLWLLKSYSEHSELKAYYANLEVINRNEARAVTGDFSAFDDGSEFSSATHDFTYDLDVFGPASLYQYLNRTCTGYGSEVLAKWLSDPYILSGRIRERQNAVKDLSARKSWRQSFMASGMGRSLTSDNIASISAWLQKETSGPGSLLLRLAIWVLPAATILSLALTAASVIHYSVFVFLFLLNTFIIILNLKKSSAVHEELSGKFGYLSSLAKLINIVGEEKFDADLLILMKGNIEGDSGNASVSLSDLGKIIRAFDSRLNILAAAFLEGVLLWDLHCIRRLDNWKREHRENFPAWLNNIGEIDALCSLGNYAHNNPGFAYPVVSAEGDQINARNLGHQLINSNVRVTNDFRFPGKGNIYIISGANMAGKSTFLRSVAINQILAMEGAPVCATEMSFTPVRLFTSMRTTDSLSSNESYFYAELKRLKTLWEKLQLDENAFFILDEILKGTNSDDKSLGSRLFLARLIELRGTGMIATHDTSLGTMEKEFPGRITNKCIEVEIDGENINFDYKLREGIASKRNAVLLMRQMGIIG